MIIIFIQSSNNSIQFMLARNNRYRSQIDLKEHKGVVGTRSNSKQNKLSKFYYQGNNSTLPGLYNVQINKLVFSGTNDGINKQYGKDNIVKIDRSYYNIKRKNGDKRKNLHGSSLQQLSYKRHTRYKTCQNVTANDHSKYENKAKDKQQEGIIITMKKNSNTIQNRNKYITPKSNKNNKIIQKEGPNSITKMQSRQKQKMDIDKKISSNKIQNILTQRHISKRSSLRKKTEASQTKLAQMSTQQLIKQIKYQKGRLIAKQMCNIFSNSTAQQLNRIKQDLNLVRQIFGVNGYIYKKYNNIDYVGLNGAANDADSTVDNSMYRKYFFLFKTDVGRLMFFFCLELDHAQSYVCDQYNEQWLNKQIKYLHYQIYYGLIFKIPQLAMFTFLQLVRICLHERQYEKAEYFCQNLLKIAVSYDNIFYEESALEYIGLCQYKLGDITGARNLFDNLSCINSQKNRSNFISFYNQKIYLFMLRHYLFNGEELKISENVRLIQTMVFKKENIQIQDETIVGKTSRQRVSRQSKFENVINKHRQKNIISRINKNINEFKLSQQKASDLRKSSKQKAILSLKQQYLPQINSNLDYCMTDSQVSNLRIPNRNSQNNTGKIHNVMNSWNNKVIVDSKLVDIKTHNILRSHETVNWNENKIKQNLQNKLNLGRNIKYFVQFASIFSFILDKFLICY